MCYPESANFNEQNKTILLTFENKVEAKIKVKTKQTHLTFELVSISNSENIELIVWGPYPTTINKVIGETVGVVQGDDFASGIQALNPKTLGGYPWNENDCMPQLDIFELNKQFPHGWDGLKKCVEKAKAHNIMMGIHTLSNFITTNDLYVTPVPDKRLAKVGTSIIIEDIDPNQTEIPVESPDFFNQFKNNHLRTVVVGNELIRYGEVTKKAPWKLLNCQRGTNGTTASFHQKGEKISKLAGHAYKVFLTNAELSIEVSKKIAELFNKTGVRQISFDGLEGNRSTGMGNYGEILFTQTWFENLNDEIRQHYIADAGRTSHYFWHFYTRMNWGEPWYAGFRESQTEYRLKNQKYFKRNLMPAMLDWFKMTPETSIEDIEWMLVRSAAFNAGYGLVTSYKTLEENAHSEKILKLLGEWEKARLSGVFSDEQKQRMKNLNNEFHLETINENQWNIFQIYSYKFKHEKKVRQHGEPLYSTFTFENPVAKQPVNFILTAVNSDLKDIKMELGNYKEISLPITLKAGVTIKYNGKEKAIVYNKNWQKLKETSMDASVLTVSRGEHTLTFDCNFAGGKEPKVKLEVRIVGKSEKVKIQ